MTAEGKDAIVTGLPRTTPEALVDFDLVNSGRKRRSLGAVNMRTGNLVMFDSCKMRPDIRRDARNADE